MLPPIPLPHLKQVRVACDHLATSDLVGILARAEDSVLHQFTEDFKG